MLIVDKYLKNLVENNRRVIVPTLGAFLLKENENGERTIIFSSFLKYNDGFLEDEIAKRAKISKDKAIAAIKKFINAVERSLASKNNYTVEGFGYFTVDNKGSLSFRAFTAPAPVQPSTAIASDAILQGEDNDDIILEQAPIEFVTDDYNTVTENVPLPDAAEEETIPEVQQPEEDTLGNTAINDDIVSGEEISAPADESTQDITETQTFEPPKIILNYPASFGEEDEEEASANDVAEQQDATIAHEETPQNPPIEEEITEITEKEPEEPSTIEGEEEGTVSADNIGEPEASDIENEEGFGADDAAGQNIVADTGDDKETEPAENSVGNDTINNTVETEDNIVTDNNGQQTFEAPVITLNYPDSFGDDEEDNLTGEEILEDETGENQQEETPAEETAQPEKTEQTETAGDNGNDAEIPASDEEKEIEAETVTPDFNDDENSLTGEEVLEDETGENQQEEEILSTENEEEQIQEETENFEPPKINLNYPSNFGDDDGDENTADEDNTDEITENHEETEDAIEEEHTDIDIEEENIQEEDAQNNAAPPPVPPFTGNPFIMELEAKRRKRRRIWAITGISLATIIAGGLAYCIVTNGGPRFFNAGAPKRSDFGYFTEFPILIENSTTITPDTAKILISPTSISSEALRYHIVAGCFTERINAERFLQSCLEKGFAAELLPGIGDMHPVSVDKSTSYEEAIAKRDEYNARHSEKAWIYRTY